MTDENIRRGNSGVMQKSMQLLRENSAGAPARAGITVTKTGSIVRANAGEFGDRRLHFVPRQIRIPKAGLEDYGWTSLTYAKEVHPVATDVDELAGHGVGAAVADGGDGLVGGSGSDKKGCHCYEADNNATQPATRLCCGGRGQGHFFFFG
jgi:hypothetical protein